MITSSDKASADLGIPDPAPCPGWCTGGHAGSLLTRSRREAAIFHGASAIGGGTLVNGEAVTLGMNWAERFEAGKWQPPRDTDVTVFLQVGTDCIAVDATEGAQLRGCR